MPNLFDPIQLGAIRAPNRILMAPLTRGRADKAAVPSAMMVDYYTQRASAGLIISEATGISREGLGWPFAPGLWTDEQVAAWKPVTDSVHAAGGRIVAQLWHMGRQGHSSVYETQPVSSSATATEGQAHTFEGKKDFEVARPLETNEIPRLLADYELATKNALAAGFDGVQIHAANGYLIDQFLRDNANFRTDEYGGSIENRARFLFEVVEAITKEIGAGVTGIRLSPVTAAGDSSDPQPQPLFTYVVEGLARYGLSYIHVIEGQTGGPRDFKQGDAPFDYQALRAAYQAAGGKAAWMVNNGYDRQMAIEAVESGKADVVAFGRPFISNPDLVERLRRDAPLNDPNPSTFYGRGAEGYIDYPALEAAAI
jgi:2,4-dienoyl-CoA reductase-like NADH-dependent reductase (Old Yellow Enzyme family)